MAGGSITLSKLIYIRHICGLFQSLKGVGILMFGLRIWDCPMSFLTSSWTTKLQHLLHGGYLYYIMYVSSRYELHVNDMPIYGKEPLSR